MKFILGALILLSTFSVMADYSNCRWSEDMGDMVVSEDPSLNICIGSVECTGGGSKSYRGKAICKVGSKSSCGDATECVNQPGIYSMGVVLGEDAPVMR